MTDQGREAEAERPLPAAAAAALSLGHVIEAIKHVRQAEGLGLAEAKLRVEAHVGRNPALKAQIEEQVAQLKRRVIRWVVVGDVIIIVALLLWFLGR